MRAGHVPAHGGRLELQAVGRGTIAAYHIRRPTGQSKEGSKTMKKYVEMNVTELKNAAKEKGVKGYSKMNKAALLAALTNDATTVKTDAAKKTTDATPPAGKTKSGTVKRVPKAAAVPADAHKASDNYKDKDVNGVRHSEMPHFAPLICKNGDKKYIDGGEAVYLVKEDFRKASEWKDYCDAVQSINDAVYNGKHCIAGVIALLDKHLGITINDKAADAIISNMVTGQFRPNTVDAATVEGRAYLSAKKKAAAAREAADSTNNERRQKAFKKKAAKFEAAMETLKAGGNVYVKHTISNISKPAFRHMFEMEVYAAITGKKTRADFERKEKVNAENLKKDFAKYIERAESLNAAGYAIEIPDEKHRTRGTFNKLRDAVKAAYTKKQKDDAAAKAAANTAA